MLPIAARNYTQRITRIRDGAGIHGNLTPSQQQLLQRWDDQLKLDGKSLATRTDYLEKTSNFLRHEAVTDTAVSDLGKAEVNQFLADKGTQRTVYSYKAPLRQFFLWYYTDHRGVTDSEVPRFVEKQLKDAPPRKGRVTPEDVPRKEEITQLMTATTNNRDRAVIALLADKGMRISEALSLTRSDVYRDRAGIYLMVPEAKKGYESYRKNRLTFSRPALQEWLDDHPRAGDNAPLFVNLQRRNECRNCGNRGQTGHCDQCGGDTRSYYPQMQYDAARAMINSLKERAGVRESITLHKFRHYSATADLKNDYLKERFIVKEHGWDDPSMLDRYGHLTDDEVDRARIKQMVADGHLDKSVIEDGEDGNGDAAIELELIRCPNCRTRNSPERDYCDMCNQPFTDEAGEQQARLLNALRDYIEEHGLTEEIVAQIRDDAEE